MEIQVGGNIPTQAERKPRRKKICICLLILLLTVVPVSGVFGVSGYVGWNLTHPVHQPLDCTPLDVGLSYADVVFSSRGDGLELRGWLIPAPASNKTIIFAHGYRKNRVGDEVPALPLAQALKDQGYNVLMFDFRNSGESSGTVTSVGQYEVQDLLGAVDYIKSQAEISQQIILFGFSMGAATSILAGAREPAVAAVIADSSFADLKTYLSNNLSVWTELPAVPFNQAFFMIIPSLTGLKAETVSPVQEINNLQGRPMLLIHGEEDEDIPIENSELLQNNYPQAQLLRVPGAAHVKSFATHPQLYMNAVTAFLDKL